MFPVLVDLKIIKIYTFGVFLVLAFFWSLFLLWSNIRLSSHKEEEIFDGIFVSLVGALFFGRLLYVILHFDKFGLSFLKFILINGYPGVSLIGALAGGLFIYHLYTLYQKISFFEVSDYLISAIFLSLGIGKLGSFFSGTEVGLKTTFPVAVKYAAYDGLRHPVAIYESILFFIGAYIAFRIMFAVRRETFQKGFSVFFFWWYFSAVTYALSFIKVVQPNIVHFDFNKIISLIILLTSTLYFLYYFRSRFLKIRLLPKQKKKDK